MSPADAGQGATAGRGGAPAPAPPEEAGTGPHQPGGHGTLGERTAERRAATGFGVCTLAAIGLAIVYWRGGQPQIEGLLLGIAMGGMAYGFAAWGQHLLPQGPFEEKRETLPTTPEEREAFEEALDEDMALPRRRLLLRALTAAAAAIGLALIFPIRSLGPGPGTALEHTSWRRGRRLVTDDGTPIRPGDVPAGGLVTVFPEGHAGSADSQTVLMRVEPRLIKPLPGREDWAPQGLIAYSKVCTHAGCPVGLYLAQTHQLLCPCHQSAFDVLDGARPVFGPAAARLPQLPLMIDGDGFLRAQGDFPEPVGPGFWRGG